MNENTPRISKVAADGPTTILVKWKGGAVERIDLAGWIATGGEMLAPLKEPAVFERAALSDYGAGVEWDDDDLAIDAVHLEMLAAEQSPNLTRGMKRKVSIPYLDLERPTSVASMERAR